MALNSLSKLIKPRLPSAAVGLTGAGAGVVSLERRRETLTVRRAGYVPLADGLVRPNFDEPNVSDPAELADVLGELVAGVGLGKRKRWSIALPEAATRTSILTMEGAPASRGEAEEMLRWKTERTFGAAADELRVARQRLRPDAQGRARYLTSAVRLAVLAEYEAVFASLGWDAGLLLPRHLGEAQWLMQGRAAALATDSLLVSAHREGFTAVLLRAGQPLLVRSVVCDPEDRADELYRFLLFYRDRLLAAPTIDDGNTAVTTVPAESIEQMLIAGDGFDEQQAADIIEETLATRPRFVTAEDLRLALPAAPDLNFDTLAAPAGLAALAWG